MQFINQAKMKKNFEEKHGWSLIVHLLNIMLLPLLQCEYSIR